jgi:hypothetical protein
MHTHRPRDLSRCDAIPGWTRRARERLVALSVAAILCASQLSAQSDNVVRTDDITRFWRVFDRIRTVSDTIEQQRLFRAIYVDSGSRAVTAVMAVRRYTVPEYVRAINSYPQFWRATRITTERAGARAAEIAAGIARLRTVYPALRTPTVAMTIVIFRTPGTTIDSLVLIGAELALGDSTVPTSELPERLRHLRGYFATNPEKNIAQLTVHEVVHTQQRDHPYTLLHRSLFEGIAEYVSTEAIDMRSPWPAMPYVATHAKRVAARFAATLLSPYAVEQWVYNDTNNEFGVRDLGYGVGYAVAAGYVQRSADKRRAIQELIDLNYNDSATVDRIVDRSRFFGAPLSLLRARYHESRPTVESLTWTPSPSADAQRRRLTIRFSAPLDTAYRGFDVGPAGTDYVLRVEEVVGWSGDARTLTIDVRGSADTASELLLSESFRTVSGLPLVPRVVRVERSVP